MPRKTVPPGPFDPNDNIDTKALQQATDAFDKDNLRLAEIDARFGDGLPYDKNRLIREVQFYLQQSASAMLEAGRQLIVLKEHEPRGEWLPLLADIGIGKRTAQAMMQAAVKYSGPKMAALTNLGKTKLIELMVEDNEDLEALADGGTLAGQTLDDIERMTPSELRKAMRKEREAATIKQQLLQKKDEKINQLDAELARLDGRIKLPTWPELVSQSLAEVGIAAGQIILQCEKLEVLRDQITMAEAEAKPDPGEDTEAHIETMAVHYFDSVTKAWAEVGELMHNAEELFQKYKDESFTRELNVAKREKEKKDRNQELNDSDNKESGDGK